MANTRNDTSKGTLNIVSSSNNTIKTREVTFSNQCFSSIQLRDGHKSPSVRVSVTLSGSKTSREVPINIKAEKERAIYEQINRKIGR